MKMITGLILLMLLLVTPFSIITIPVNAQLPFPPDGLPTPFPTPTPMPTPNPSLTPTPISTPVPPEGVTETIKGAIFTVPESLEDEIAEYRKVTPVNQYASLLATKDTLFVVFSDEKVETGLATVDGLKLPGMTWDELGLGVIKAKSVSVERKGEPTTINEIKSNPEAYLLKLVKIDATLRQVSFLVDPDDGSDFEIPISVGRIVEHPIKPMNFINFHEKASEFSINCNREYINRMIGVTNEGLPVFDFETKYWVDSEAEINAIVLYPEVVEEFIDESAGNEMSNLVIPEGEKILLYNVDTNLKSSEVTIREIKSDPEHYMGKVVTFTGPDMGVDVSVQETIKETQEEYPPVDVLLHGTVVWCRPPPMLEEIQTGTLITIGASSHHQDQAVKQVDGATEVLEYTGMVVSSEQIDESLPDDLVLITYKREKVGDISVDEITNEVRYRIGERILMISDILQNGETISKEPATKIMPPPTSTPELTPTPPGEGVEMSYPEEEYYEEPGFEAIFAIAGMLAVTYLLRRKR